MAQKFPRQVSFQRLDSRDADADADADVDDDDDVDVNRQRAISFTLVFEIRPFKKIKQKILIWLSNWVLQLKWKESFIINFDILKWFFKEIDILSSIKETYCVSDYGGLW